MNVCLIGGINLAIVATASKLEDENSIPCHIHSRIGGVSCNVASKLMEYADCKVSLISVLSDDFIGQSVKKELEKKSISYDHSIVKQNWESCYCHIITEKGSYGLNDMASIGNITPEYIHSIENFLNKFDLIFIDANLSKETIEYIVKNINVPVSFDGTSPEKCIRIKDFVHQLEIIKLNYYEYCRLFDVSARQDFNLEEIKKNLKSFDAKKVFITLGKDGSVCYDSGEIFSYKSSKIISAKNTLRAGDTFMSGIISGYLKNQTAHDILRIASERAEKVLLENL